MEAEKEVIFNIKRDSDYLEISSNLDNSMDYLDNEEAMALVIELLNCVINSATKSTLEKNNIQTIEDLDGEELLHNLEIVDNEVKNFIEDLIHLILNYFYTKNILENQNLDLINYSLIVYGPKKNSKTREVYDINNHNVSINEQLLGLDALCKNIANVLLKNNSKDDAKEIFNKIILITSLKVYKYVDKRNM